MFQPDGSKLIFSQSDGASGSSRKVFLTQIVDSFGNALTLTYDANLRVVAITDAIGQVTTLSCDLPGNDHMYLITRVTDPFGRFANFEYDFGFGASSHDYKPVERRIPRSVEAAGALPRT